jgi:N-carbamoyl-L-amino-acid hydrolase
MMEESLLSLRVNGERLWERLMVMAQIGATPKGGVCRVTLTDEDKDGRDLFIRWCLEAGCAITIDQLGNIFARRTGHSSGTQNQLAPVLVAVTWTASQQGASMTALWACWPD